MRPAGMISGALEPMALEANQMKFDDIGCSYGERMKVTCIDGSQFVGRFADLEIDFDNSRGGDSVSVRLDDGRYMSFHETEIKAIKPLL